MTMMIERRQRMRLWAAVMGRMVVVEMLGSNVENLRDNRVKDK